MKSFAVGMVVRDRWLLTKESLKALELAKHFNEYDLFIVNNGSSNTVHQKLNEWAAQTQIPVKNIVHTNETNIAKAWNLFLMLTKGYDYRVKFDNDLILSSVISAINTIKPNHTPIQATPEDIDSKAGAPRSSVIVRSVGQALAARRARKQMQRKSEHFLSSMLSFALEQNSDLISLVPVPPRQIFMAVYANLVTAKYNSMPFLNGACMMISKRAFNNLGYFDERLTRRIDIDYSQRAIQAGMNITYHPSLYVIHNGSGQPTDGKEAAERQQRYSIRILQEFGVITTGKSDWEIVADKIQRAARHHRIIALN